MADTTIISGRQLPIVTRRPNGDVRVQQGHRALGVPAEIADNSRQPEERQEMEDILLDPNRSQADLLSTWILLWELRDRDKTLGTLADNQGGLRNQIESATYRIVRDL